MGPLTSPKVIKEILDRHGFYFSKSLGQNFLIDGNIVEKIIEGATVDPEDNILEIGPGIGTLTQKLVSRADKVVAIEIDKGLLPILGETLGNPENLTIVHGDVLKIDLRKLVDQHFNGKAFKVVANLPYYITTPIIMRFLEEDVPFTGLTVMIQKEVALRIGAAPGGKDYSALSVAIQYYTIPRIICKVPAGVFMPKPKVDSMVITLEKREKPPIRVHDEEMFFKVVRGAFAKRRKTLLNNLTMGEFADWDKKAMAEIIKGVGIDPGRRGETLSLEEFGILANCISES